MALTLTILPPGSGAPSLPDAGRPDVEVWRDLSGAVCALGEIRGESRWLHLPGLASYRFTGSGPVVVAEPVPGASSGRIADQFFRTVLPLALQDRGHEVLHASAARLPAGVVALCATKQSGKSTLAYALARRGWPVWADDAVVLRVGERGAEALAVPFRVRLRAPSAAHFGTATGTLGASLEPEREPVLLTPERLAALFVLERRAAEGAPREVEVERLDRGAAFRAVLEHAYCFTLAGRARKQAMVESYLRLVGAVPVFALRYGTGLDLLPAILDAIERSVDASAAPA